MFLKRLKEIASPLSVRLMLWYAGLFTASALLIFGLSYLQFRSALLEQDRELIRLHAQTYASAYREGGETALRRLFDEEKKWVKNSYFVSVVTADNRVLNIHLPERWSGYDLRPLDHPSNGYQWITMVDVHNENPYEFAAVRMPDQSVLQVGLNIASNEVSMERFQHIFWGTLLPIVLLSFAAGAWMTTRTLQPIRQLTASIEVILRTGTLSECILPGKQHDELHQLVVLFNQMLEKNHTLIAGMREALDTVAHDLRTPMTRFRGTAELALQTATSTAMQEALANGLEQSEQILQTLDTLIDISEAETGAMHLKRTEFPLADLLTQVEEVYRYLAEEKRMTLTVACAKDFHITADRSRLGRVLANLMDNAIKYTPEGGQVTVSAALLDKEIVVTVKDTGVGIAQGELPRIWERLYRIDPSRHERGLGLGLTLVKAIVQAHHGQITVDSQVGQGSTFTLHLPV